MKGPDDDLDLQWPCVTLARALGQTLDRMEEAGGRDQRFVPTGIRDIDRHLGGLPAGEVTVLSGTRRSGKTSLALVIGLHVAANAHRHVLYVTTQEPMVSLTQRLIKWESGLELSQIVQGRLRKTEWSAVGRAVENLSEVPLNFYAHPFPSLDQITLAVARVELEGTLDMVIVDCVQDFRGWSKAHSWERRELVDGLVSLAKTSRVPVVAIAPLKRSAEQHPPPFEIDDLRCTAAMKRVHRFIFIESSFVATPRQEPPHLNTSETHNCVTQLTPSIPGTDGLQVIL